MAATAQGQGTGAGAGDLAQPGAYPLFWAEDFSDLLPPDTYYISATTGSGMVEGGFFMLTQTVLFRNRIDRLLALVDRVADQAHAAKFTGDVHARYVGLEFRRHHGNVDAAFFGAEHQRYGIERAGSGAGAVSDATGRVDQLCLAVYNTEHLMQRALGAGGDAGSAALA